MLTFIQVGSGSIGDRAQGAMNAASDKFDQTKHEGSAKANKNSV